MSLALLLTTLALANPPSATAVEKAEALIKEGVQLRRIGDDLSALPVFQRAYETAPSPRTAAQLGLVQQALGRWAEAETHLAEALAAREDPWIAKNRPVLEKSMRTVKVEVGSLEIVGEPAGAEVLINGRKVGNLPLPRALRVSRGNTQVEVQAPGHKSEGREIQVEPGQFHNAVFRLQPIAAAVTAVVKQEPDRNDNDRGGMDATTPDKVPPRNWVRVGAWVGLASGAALLVVGGMSHVVRENKAASFGDEMNNCFESPDGMVTSGIDPARCIGIRKNFNTATKYMWVGYIAGAALAIPSVTVLLAMPSGGDSSATAMSCGPWLGTAGGTCTFAF